MKTFRLTENDIKDKKVLATGYKIFKNDFTSRYGYRYADENGNVLNSIHTVNGDIIGCQWGLHFSKNPQDCFNFYECVQWNKFAKVEAYDKIVMAGKKIVAQTIKIVKLYTFGEFINLIQDFLQCENCGGNDIYGGNRIEGGNYIYGGNRIRGGNYICGGNDICGGNRIEGGNDICGGNRIEGGNDICGGNDIYGGNRIEGGNDICGGNDIYGGNRIEGGNDIYGGNRIEGGNDIYGGNRIEGGNDIWGALDCEGISKSIFCYKKSGKLMIFNKKTTEKRFFEVFSRLRSFDWYPIFNNAYDLKGNLEWFETNIPEIVRVPNEIAWSYMPQEMKNYIYSLPEFNEKIFKKITGKIK